MTAEKYVILGAGPAGLGAGLTLSEHGGQPLLLEKAGDVGGLSKTYECQGFKFDLGGHRFFSKIDVINALWRETLQNDWLVVNRQSRILHGNRLFAYPLHLSEACRRFNPIASMSIYVSYLVAKLRSEPQHPNLEQWLIHRFGKRLYHLFFESFSEKVWGRPCCEISADWAVQRIQTLSIHRSLMNAISKKAETNSLIRQFYYPRHGAGQMWRQIAARIRANGGTLCLDTTVQRIDCDNDRVGRICYDVAGAPQTVSVRHLCSSLPLPALLELLHVDVPAAVSAAVSRLSYRAFVLVFLIVDSPRVFPDQWIYIQNRRIRAGRVQNFNNWSSAMSPNPRQTGLGVEYFCQADDAFYQQADVQWIDLATHEMAQLGWITPSQVIGGRVVRAPRAYPIYDLDYRRHLQTIQAYLATFRNLHIMGRNGTHTYLNMDAAMYAGILAAQHAMGIHNVSERPLNPAQYLE